MMNRIFLILILCAIPAFADNQDFLTPFEKSDGNYTATYDEAINFYYMLDEQTEEIRLISCGATDIGIPLHLVVISKDKSFDPNVIHNEGKAICMINNGIHPGEPEGIDASMMLARDLVNDTRYNHLLEHVVVIIVPIYNIGGALNRGGKSRANQNGPREYGFRGNAKNIDLNRDFIKCDSKNAESFVKIFNRWKPHIFIDTHTSNGADYKYVMTYIATQKDKLHPILSEYMTNRMIPALHSLMVKKEEEMIPYVNPLKVIPDSGIVGFLETPRYSTGYTSLFNTIGFTLETHMLKPFNKRVKATYQFLLSTLEIMNNDHAQIVLNKQKANQAVKHQEIFSLGWQLDKSEFEMIKFKGYTAAYLQSEVTGKDRLYYDTTKPYEKTIHYYNTFRPTISIEKPTAYLIPKQWSHIVELMKINSVKIKPIMAPMDLEVETYFLDDYKTIKSAFEGHFLHYQTQVRKENRIIHFNKGDYMAMMDQPANRFIIEVLEPEGVDSYFNWNYFDQVLQQKEWYSSYVFEDLAAQLLKEKPELKKRLEAKKKDDPEFAQNPNAQLYFIYINSPYFEKDIFLQYPVYRLVKKQNLKIE